MRSIGPQAIPFHKISSFSKTGRLPCAERSAFSLIPIHFVLSRLNSVVSVLFSVAGLYVPDILIRLFTNEPILIDLGVVYLRIRVSGVLPYRRFPDLSMYSEER